MKKSILIADSDKVSREFLKQLFEPEYNTLTVDNGKDAVIELGRHIQEVVIMLLAVDLHQLNGMQVLQVLHARNVFHQVPLVMIAGHEEQEEQIEAECYTLGATAIIHKPFSAALIRNRVKRIVDLREDVTDLQQKLKSQEQKLLAQRKELESFYDNLLDAISNIVEFRNMESAMHVKRVKGFTMLLAQTYMQLFPEEGLTPARIKILVRAAAIHDIGKIAIPDSILLKPGRLTPDEREVMMGHTTKGCEILNLLSDVQDAQQLKVSYDVVRHHHERYDGKGYPDGLKGDELSLEAQIVSMADVYDALVSERTYKMPYDKNKAFQMIKTGECGAFTPNLLSCLEHAKSMMESFSDTYQD